MKDIIALTLLCACVQTAHADIYQCKKDGKNIFQGQPCEETGEKMELRVLKPSTPDEGEFERRLIVGRQVAVGMTESALIRSWGKPDRINRSSHGDQWVYERGGYKRQYIYVKNGRVTSWNE